MDSSPHSKWTFIMPIPKGLTCPFQKDSSLPIPIPSPIIKGDIAGLKHVIIASSLKLSYCKHLNFQWDCPFSSIASSKLNDLTISFDWFSFISAM